MAEPRIYKTAVCPVCNWFCNRSFFLPKHILKHHAANVTLSSMTSDHCIYANINTSKQHLDFCACLTCKKGFLGDVTTSYGSRWFNEHSIKKECKEAHADAFVDFKKRTGLTTPPSSDVPLSPAIHVKPMLLYDPLTADPPPPVTSTSTGYVYCFANESMPGILKIGMTTRTPLDRLEEANSSDTWKPPTPYTVELAKSVSNPKDKENTIHKLLEKYSEKIHDRREFFRISVDDVRLFFDLMDGEYWTTSPTQEKSKTKRKIKKKATVAPKN